MATIIEGIKGYGNYNDLIDDLTKKIEIIASAVIDGSTPYSMSALVDCNNLIPNFDNFVALSADLFIVINNGRISFYYMSNKIPDADIQGRVI